MTQITLAKAIEARDAWVEASIATAAGQSYSIGNRSLTRADAAEIQKQIGFWERTVKSLTASANTGVSGGPAVAVFK